MSASMTRAPWAARMVAHPSPMPRPAPVTIPAGARQASRSPRPASSPPGLGRYRVSRPDDNRAAWRGSARVYPPAAAVRRRPRRSLTDGSGGRRTLPELDRYRRVLLPRHLGDVRGPPDARRDLPAGRANDGLSMPNAAFAWNLTGPHRGHARSRAPTRGSRTCTCMPDLDTLRDGALGRAHGVLPDGRLRRARRRAAPAGDRAGSSAALGADLGELGYEAWVALASSSSTSAPRTGSR